MWHPRRSAPLLSPSSSPAIQPQATLPLPGCSLPVPWKHPTRLRASAFCRQVFLSAFFSSAWHRAGAQNTVFEWRNEFLRNPQLSDIKVSANWILFSSKDFAAAECFHTFVKGMKSTYEDLSLFSCLQTHCRQAQGFLAGARQQGTVPEGEGGRLCLMDETGLPQANKTGEGI